jgi:Nitrate reductase delta subunit
MATSPPCAAPVAVHGGRWELLRALGAIASTPPPLSGPVAASLGLPQPTAAEHTGVFVLSAPPHAAIYLGAEGKLGGGALDRAAGFWRALGLAPPPDADHLGALLALYAELGDAEAAARSERARAQPRRAREALLWEHLWSWAPGYLTAVERLGTPSLGPWARLALRALAREAGLAAPSAALPLALRSAPPALRAPGAGSPRGLGRRELLDALLAPVRSGVVITSADLREAATVAGVGYRLGERRYTLAAMLDQDGAATIGWLRALARRWARWHARQRPVPAPDPRQWWAGRARGTAAVLSQRQEGPATAGYSGA